MTFPKILLFASGFALALIARDARPLSAVRKLRRRKNPLGVRRELRIIRAELRALRESAALGSEYLALLKHELLGDDKPGEHLKGDRHPENTGPYYVQFLGRWAAANWNGSVWTIRSGEPGGITTSDKLPFRSDVPPHRFVGRSDRHCQIDGCNRPDRDPIHDARATVGAPYDSRQKDPQ